MVSQPLVFKLKLLTIFEASIIISQVAPYLQNFGSAVAAFKKLEKDMNHKSALDGTIELEGKSLDKVSGSIEFKNVSFTYPSRPDQPVIKKISMICPAGKHTAIVGLSGSGKSTISSLIARLYDVDDGLITLDGQDIRDLNLRNFRSFVNLVQQDPSLY